MSRAITRRQFLAASAAAGVGSVALARATRAATTATVSVARCDTYGPELVGTLESMFDRLGGLGRLVSGKTVAVKLNLTGPAWVRLGNLPAGRAHWVHPRMVGAVVHLIDRAGARRVRLLESGYATDTPLDEYMYQAGWDVPSINGAGRRVELLNTNTAGPRGDEYHRFDVPGGGLLFPSYLLNPAFRDCDVFVSLAKLKDHTTTGVTLSMKNCFGNIPTTVYGDHSPLDRPDERPRSGRNYVFHDGSRAPSLPAAREKDPISPRHEGYRIPRVVVDVCGARPIDLAIIDGIDSMGGTEGPWSGGEPCHPGVLLAGTNCVNTDAVATAVMGYDPMARGGEVPFRTCDNLLELAEEKGLGTRDLHRIEVAGTPIAKARFDFAPMIRSRHPRSLPPYPAKTHAS
jgi:uncharacterized protein (DUF362 family)